MGVCLSVGAFSQTTVFSDDFSTNQSAIWTTSGVIGASSWSVSRSGDDWGVRRNTSPAQLELTNDASATGNVNGWAFASVATSSFSSPYNTTLSSNTGVVTWTFNMRQIRTDPAGFVSGSYGVAFVLAGSSTTINNSGNGYAVVLGQSGSTDPIRLAKYNNGLQGTLTNIVTSNTSGLTDFGAEYLSIKVTYTPNTNTWELFLRNDGASAFADPASGTLTSQGTAVENTYTGSALAYLGGYWQGSTGATQTAFFDNVKVIVAASSPTITLNPTTLTGFNYTEDAGPSAEQTFTVSGVNLTDNISISASTNYEISKTSGSGYTTPLTFTQSGGTVSSTTVYVRLKAGLNTGTYNSENITASSSGATNKTVTCSGSVVDYPNWCNVHPGSGSITTGYEFLVYAQVYEPSLTEAVGQGAGVTCHIGYSTSNTNPNTWTNWVAATYHGDADGMTPGDHANDEYKLDIGPYLNPAGTYYVASRFSLNGGATYSYGGYSSGGGGFWDGSSYVSCVVTVTANYPDWCNLQWPASGNITVGGEYLVYAQVYESGVTEAAGQGTNVTGWIGYNTSNTNPNTWTNWVAATFNSQSGNNDEFKADIGTALPAGTYYYASRFKVNPNANEYKYGGYNSEGGDFWDGSSYVSGVLTVTAPGGCADDLFISEYGEGSSGNSKYIEIYNGTGSSITLSNYRIWIISNGGSWPESYYNFTTVSLADGETLVVGNNATDVPGADEYSGTMSWNGNDAVGLAKNDGDWQLIDAIGEDGSDPGTGWAVAGTINATVDKRLTRKETIYSGNTNWDLSRGTTSDNSEWIVTSYTSGSAVDGHTMICPTGTSTITAGAGSEPATISSLIDTQGEAVLNFDFTVTDDGATPATDALNTFISKIIITQGTGNDISDWTQAIAGALLTDGTATQTANIAINSTNITISSIAHAGGSDLGYIADNGAKTYTLKIWLKSSLGGTLPSSIDGLNLVFRVQDSGITLDGGSGFEEDQDQNSGSTKNAVAVVATELIFTTGKPPSTGNPATNFPVRVSAVDANSNIDLGATNSITLTKESGSGTLSSASGLTKNLSSGVYEWSDCQFNLADTYKITATTTGLSDNNVTSWDIVIAYNANSIIISEMCDPLNNYATNRYIEIYNPTSSTIDLTGCKVEAIGNGEVIHTWNLSGTIASCTAKTCGDDGNTAFTPDFISATWSSANTDWNGKAGDGARFKNSGSTIVDDAGSHGNFENKTTVRLASVTVPTTSFSSAEWTSTAVADAGSGASTPATHICNSCNCSEPTTNSTSLSFSSITATTINVSIGTPGNGYYRLIVARQGSAVSFTPTDLTTYEANSVFSDATDLGSGNKVVYSGTGTSVTVSGLNGNTTYYFKVFEFNCSAGYEDYYTGGTLLAGSATTLISPVTNLQVLCQTNTTATITWTAPVRDYTGVIIGVRNSTLVPHTISNNASTYTANNNFEDGTQYGSTTPYSYVVYKGTGTSVTVTGLTQGQAYSIKAYTYKNETGSVWSTTPTTSISSLSTADVTENFVLTGNTELQLQWTNPNSACFDEVMIVCNAGSAITTQPTGDGSTYSANLTFGSGSEYSTGYVVYKGTYSPQTVTGLSNGTEYCFTWFVRNGTTWSQGVSNCETPTNVTILQPGDLAIVAVNTQATSVGSADEICFFTFKDITEGTSIDFTDNGYERLYDGLWASSEGTIRMTRTGGGTISAGRVICFQGMGYTQSGFSIYNCGNADDENWTITSLNSAGSVNGSYDLNVDDQIWIIQGGAWANGGSLSAHEATYSGNVLFGWTATGWEPVPGYDDTKGSTLYPSTECFMTNVSVAANHSKVKYIGDVTETSQFNWIGRINDNTNWLGFASNTAYYTTRDYSSTCYQFTSNQSIGDISGIWTGAENEDWFDCGNWQNLKIPLGNTNVIISGAISNDITVDDGITSQPEAICNNLTIEADALVGANPVKLKVNNSNSVLRIYGNMKNNQIIQHTAGEIYYYGNFENNDTYTHTTAGIAIFEGSSPQTITGATTFYNLKLNNTSTGVTIANNITVNNILTLTDGLINTGTNMVIVENNSTSSVTGHSTESYINGNLRRKVAATGEYDLPVGTSSYFELAKILLTSSSVTYFDAKFTNPHTGTTLPTSPYLTVDGTELTELLDYGFWTIAPVSGTSTDYDITLTSRGHTNGGEIATQHTIVKRDNSSSDWASYEDNHDNSTQSGTGTDPITAKLTDMNGFCDAAIAKSKEFPLPVELLYLKADVLNETVLLEWVTLSEINNDYFEIQRSHNGIDFMQIGKLYGAGNSNNKNYYYYTDDDPIFGISYYRLKQIDFDGVFSFSKTISVLLNSNKKLDVKCLYNPEYATTLLIDNPYGGNLNIRITDMSGKIVRSDVFYYLDNPVTLNIDKTGINPGLYIFNVFNNFESITVKVVVY
jgi:hypothetical protein